MSVTYDRTQHHPNPPRHLRTPSTAVAVSDTPVSDTPVSESALAGADTIGMLNPAASREHGDLVVLDAGEQALDLPGEEVARLRANRPVLLGVWTIALIVTAGYIGIPLTMFLVPVLGGSLPAIAVSLCAVVVGSLALRVILRAILSERHRSAS